MKTYFKKTTSIALISLCGLSLTGLAIAMPNGHGDNGMKRGMYQLEREYSLTEINTLVEARLLRSRHADQVLESIKETDLGTYLVEISNPSGEDRTIELNKFAMPVEAPIPGFYGKHKKRGHGKWAKFGKGDESRFRGQGDMEQGNLELTPEQIAMNDQERGDKRGKRKNTTPLTLEEITTLTQAKLIRLNNDNLKLGQIVNNEEGGFTVTILDTQDDVISRFNLTETGYPEFKKKHRKNS